MRYVSTRNRFLEIPETTDDKWVALIESHAGLLPPCGRASTLQYQFGSRHARLHEVSAVPLAGVGRR